MPGQPMLELADVEYLQIRAEIPARLRVGLREGMMLRAEVDLSRAPVPVRVAQIFPSADPVNKTVRVKFDLPQGVAEPGMFAQILVPDVDAPASANPVVPSSAIRYLGGMPAVYVVEASDNGNTKRRLRLIRLGEPVPEGLVTVLSGLRPGESVLKVAPPASEAGWDSGD